MPEVAEWRFPRGGGVQVYSLHDRAGSGNFTLAVTALDEQIALLDNLNIDLSQRPSSDKVRTVMEEFARALSQFADESTRELWKQYHGKSFRILGDYSSWSSSIDLSDFVPGLSRPGSVFGKAARKA